MIYNQGFEVIIQGRKFFAFSMYKQSGKIVESLCHSTFPGWVHDTDERNWGCYLGEKRVTQSGKRLLEKQTRQVPDDTNAFKMSESFIEEINSKQTLWKAANYRHMQQITNTDVMRMAGGRRSARSFPPTKPVTNEELQVTGSLPTSFDWRNKDGVNYVSPIRNQGGCGSCYAFGSMALHEARLRIMSNNTIQTVFSTQDIVSCSEYSQGCEGGFPYLTDGKYGQDFGLIEESCFPYEGRDMPCKTNTCKRHYTRDYYYIGGYYGACNEPLMREELVKNGPIAVSFEVYKDFLAYKGGIYHHTGIEDKFNPWEITNHVVLIVGYGEEDGTKYWVVKNSWGTEWGEQGFFRIRRGNDECSIESMAVGTFPILD